MTPIEHHRKQAYNRRALLLGPLMLLLGTVLSTLAYYRPY